MVQPKVSILMATWNRSGIIGKTIESVRGQSFQDWELIISDDGSTDNTPQVVAEWQKKEPRIIYLRSEINQGISKNYNMGLRSAKGEYVAIIDDDDPWCEKEKLQKQVDFLDKNRDYAGCGAGIIVVDRQGKELYRYLKPQTDEQIRGKTLFSNPMANSTTMFRRELGEKVGWYDETMPYSGDRDFWLKIGLRGKLYNFPEYFSYYTMSGNNTSIVNIRPHLRASLIVMRRYKENYPHYALALLFNWVQYIYSFLPAFIRSLVHYSLARLKRLVVG
ncbi:MAG: glycosyltransferase family 2 protein [Patescibacteria group bacterium]|nr:glycosyltransferase family 2 protein [Patescibacteria group bacterium]MDE2015280.1 glycosyltransferase family 2 protein [Patescibacteria group bacterium]MDE2227086.1 glycosyltransferase family 2 protein [Patescibacteria group bacterium]